MKHRLDEVIEEAKYCLNCKTKPCREACPLSNDIPAFIEQIKNQDFDEGRRILRETTFLPAVCGRICPKESQCEGSCVRGIKGKAVQIGMLEAMLRRIPPVLSGHPPFSKGGKAGRCSWRRTGGVVLCCLFSEEWV